MEVFNQTPFLFAPIVGWLGYPKHSLTLVVKATFDLKPDGVATPSEEQPFPTGDEPYPDDEEQTGGPRYESDLAFFKPHADLLLAGKCYAPGGTPTKTCAATFRVGNKSRTLTVVGDRYWDKGLLRSTVTEAKPFTEMPIRYESAFGGQGFKNNPVGKGYAKVVNESGQDQWPLPNIEDPQSLIVSPRDRPEPAGFGPLGKMWQERHTKLGTYKGVWLKTRFPWFPEDLDWTHFNAAPQAMQVEGYLSGDEEIYLENLHPEHAQYRCRLPGLRVRCFLNQTHEPEGDLQAGGSSPPNNASEEFREVVMHLDTLWVDAEAQQLVLLWRGHAPVLSEDYEEVAHLFIMSELLTEPSASLEQCRVKFQEAQAQEEAQWNPPPEEPEEETSATPPPDASDAPAPPQATGSEKGAGEQAQDPDDPLASLPPEVKAAAIDSQEKFRQACLKSGIDPDNLPPLTPEAKKLQARYLKIIGFTDDEMLEGGIDPGDIPPDTPQEKQEQAKLREQMGMPEEQPKPDEEPQAKAEGEGETPPLTRERVQQRAANGESLTGEDLSGLDLSGLDLSGIDFSQAIFADVSLAEAKLDAANLAGANLADVDMTRASLKGTTFDNADLAGARLSGADLSNASLCEAVFEKAIMDQAVFDKAVASDAVLSGADLSGASFRGCNLDGADLSKSTLTGAHFEDASLIDTSLEGVSGNGVVMDGADLTRLRASENADFTGGSFRETTAQESMWVQANLQGTDFSYAAMEGADFTKADLRNAILYAADMKFSRFTKADLRCARLTEMNLFEGSLEKANLEGTDLTGSNLYGAEFLESQTSGMIAENTNLKMTKLANR